MTAWISDSPKTKKALKQMIGQSITVVNPHPMSAYGMDHPLNGIAVVGPGAYERKWYAQVWTDKDGILLKVK